MKRIFVIATALLFMGAQGADAQSLLNKLKEKAENAVGSVSEKVAGAIGNVSITKDEAEDDSYDPETDGVNVARPDQKLERRRTSTFAWTEAVTPSTAKFPVPLMNEFPKVPSAAELANPTEEGMAAYYRAIKKVTLRAEELNADETCGDEFAEQWREKIANDMAAQFGMTRAEFDRFMSDDISEAERDAIGQKIVQSMMGADLEALAALEGTMNSGVDAQTNLERATQEAAMKVYSEDPSETRYVTGKTPAELKALMAQQPESYENELKAYEKSMEAKDGAAYKKRRDAFQKKLQSAVSSAASSALGLGSLMNVTKNATKQAGAMNEVMKLMQTEQQYIQAMMELESIVGKELNVDSQFSAAEKKKLEDIKKKIDATDDPDVYNPLYLQALESIKSYRLRAAAVWGTAVQKKVDDIKAGVTSFIKTNREMIEAGVLPECALYRTPFNVVIETGDILEDAYSEFPSNYPPMYSENIVLEVNDYLYWPEFILTDDINGAMNNYLYKNGSNGKTLRYDGGKWSPVPANFDYNKVQVPAKPASTSWKSSDGKREVIYNADGNWIQLPEGDVVYPVAFEKNGNKLEWIVSDVIEMKDGTVTTKITKCTYKL